MGTATPFAKTSPGKNYPFPEGPARHLDASRQKLTPHCLAAILDSQLPSSKLSLEMPPKLPLPHNRGHFFLFQNCPRGEGNCGATERQKLSRGNFCLAASRCLSGPSGLVSARKISQNFTPRTAWKTENFTQISLCWSHCHKLLLTLQRCPTKPSKSPCAPWRNELFQPTP